MRRMKKPLVWLTLFSLIISLFPVGLISTAEAATATYFIPNDQELRNTANNGALIMKEANPRGLVKVVNTPTLSIKGAYSKLAEESLAAEIELLMWNGESGTWEANSQYSTNGEVTVDPSSRSRFEARSLTLFPGLNRITLKGKFGSAEGNDVFYVMYDKLPYFTKLTLTGSGMGNQINLDEDARVISKNPMVSISGEVYNATKATVSVNDGQGISTDVFNNMMGSSSIPLTEGLNKLKITFTNGSDSFSVVREVYYFTSDNPYVGLFVSNDAGKTSFTNILNTVPNIKRDTRSDADYIVQVMLPYNSGDDKDKFFPNNHEVSVNANGTEVVYTKGTGAGTYEVLSSKLYNDNGELAPVSASGDEETIINDAAGPAYRQITLKLHGVPFTSNELQKPEIQIRYNKIENTIDPTAPATYDTTARISPSFNLSDKTTITSINYLPDYTEVNKNAVNKQPLEGAIITQTPYFIEVTTDSSVDSDATLEVRYVAGNKLISGTLIEPSPDSSAKVKLYRINESASGEKKIRFEYVKADKTPASLPKEANVSFTTAAGIIINNLTDGQTYEVDSELSSTIKISGEYSKSVVWENKEYFANGISSTTFASGTTNETLSLTNSSFSVAIPYGGATAPLTIGENTIEFKGIYRDNLGNQVPVSKKLRIYLSDKKIPSVKQFIPSRASTDNSDISTEIPFPLSLATNAAEIQKQRLADILKLPTIFNYNNGKYTTSTEEYTLVIRGSGTNIVNLSIGSQKILDGVVIPTSETNDTSLKKDKTDGNHQYEIIGSDKDFLIRVRNLSNTQGQMRFERGSTGTHVYNLELINSVGARITQRLEITRELAGLEIISPKATTGDQIIVNKNFVRMEIRAEGADKVLIGKDEATRRTETGMTDRFVYDYVGLKPDKMNSIKVQAVRAGSNINQTVNVYYTSSVGIDTQYMAEKVSNKYTAFNKALTLSFPKGTVLQSMNRNNPMQKERKFYPDNKILFGIADPRNGVVERVNDEGLYYGSYIDPNNTLLASYFANFTTTAQTFNFSRISDVYWISGGLGESGSSPATNGVTPYSREGFFTSTALADREIVPSERGTLTIAYNKNVVNDAGTQVTVFKYTDVGGGRGLWERVPGNVNTSQNTVTVPFDEFGYYAVYKLNRSFSDVTNHPWARNILNALYSKGIMEYLRADAFGADDQTTRGEFATLLVKGLSLPINADRSQQAFFDVSYGIGTTTWDYEHLETAARAGIITGKSEGFFSPNMPITRQEAAVMIARAAKLKLDSNDDKLSAKLAKSYLDSGRIEYYARPAVQAVSAAKIMSGSPVTIPGAKKASFNFNPTGNMTRAEAAKVAVELFKSNKSTKDMFPKNFN